jgi:hypothetical protein
MTFREKYKNLQNLHYVIEMISKSVYDTMHLEGQGVSKTETQEIVERVMREPEPKLSLKAN